MFATLFPILKLLFSFRFLSKQQSVLKTVLFRHTNDMQIKEDVKLLCHERGTKKAHDKSI